eukprot:TRINITY_DN748_c0_g1_i1.p1 TRINITY_DN748_c0_g1~~TRINITY_DN748_c0_g1_i1.p1  ORF type:complete len:378 (+),score=32.84 TRINITY_DN748_c0_g1_i1:65-1198(+)
MMLPQFHDDGGEAKGHRRQSCWSSFRGFLSSVFQSEESRSIFFFLLINLSFAFVELFYGILSNSLGLVSDSFHMFFDCTALVAGLVASVVSRRPANERFSYGYQRAEVLGGFVNGLFLVFIAFFVLKEALERFFDPPNIHTHRLVLVSIGGLLVNLIGVFAFQHAHSHGHGGAGCDHGHSHGHAPARIHDDHDHGHSHGHSHGHGHDDHGGHAHNGHAHGHSHGGHGEAKQARSFVLDGVLLHVLADTLGSVGVIISSLIIHQYGWMIADPVCSIFISVLIFMSTWPLLRDSFHVLMQRTPATLEGKLFRCYRQINLIDGVISYKDPHFWSMSREYNVGTITIVIKTDANDTSIRSAVTRVFTDAGVKRMTVQTERF